MYIMTETENILKLVIHILHTINTRNAEFLNFEDEVYIYVCCNLMILFF